MTGPLDPVKYPIRQASARGIPAEKWDMARKCVTCRASFLGLAPGKTGERGLWRDWSWYCSIECAPADWVATLTDTFFGDHAASEVTP